MLTLDKDLVVHYWAVIEYIFLPSGDNKYLKCTLACDGMNPT